VTDVAERLGRGIEKIVKRHQDKSVVLALGQFAYAIVRCQYDDGNYEHFWEYVDGEVGWHAIELSQESFAESPAADPPQSSKE